MAEAEETEKPGKKKLVVFEPPRPEDFVAWVQYVKGPQAKVLVSSDPDHLTSPLFFNLTLIKWRTFLMLSQYDAAKLLGVSDVVYKKWEDGIVIPKFVVRKAICDYIRKWIPRGLELDDVVEAVKEKIKSKESNFLKTQSPTLEAFVYEDSEYPKRQAIVPPLQKESVKSRQQQIREKILAILEEKKVATRRDFNEQMPWLSYVEMASTLLSMTNAGILDRTRVSGNVYLYWKKGDTEAEEIAKSLKPKKIRV